MSSWLRRATEAVTGFIVIASVTTSSGSDPITAFLSRDWAALGGWGLLTITWVCILWGALKEMWVPGNRYRRLEESSIKMADANAELQKQNGQLITSN